MIPGIDYIAISISYLCHDGHGNYLFAKRGKNCRDEWGMWDNGGGKLELGDCVEERLAKEIKEEYCADIIESEFLGYRDVHREHDGKSTHWIALTFKVRIDRSKVKIGEPHKFDDIGWFTLDKLPSPLHSQFEISLKKFHEKL